MTREQIKGYLELFKAYSEGKEIEKIVPGEKGWKWVPAKELHLNDLGSFRIKPELKLRPYKNAEEFLKAQKEHGPYLKMGSGFYVNVLHINDLQINYVGHDLERKWAINNFKAGYRKAKQE